MAKISLDLDALTTSHIITPDIRDAILTWHNDTTRWEGTSRFVQILSSFGAIVTGLGVMLLIASNWDTMSDVMKTTIMIGSTLSIYAIAYYFCYRNTSYPKTWQAIMLLGAMFYGASIMLLGQIYNLGGTFSQALIVWTIPVILLAYLTQFVTLYTLGIALIYLYISIEIFDRYDFSGFVIANIVIAVGYLSVSLTRYHMSEWYRSFGKILSWTGGASILGGLFAYTFIDFWKYGGNSWYSERSIDGTMWILFAIVGLGALSIIIDVIRKQKLDIVGDVPFLLALVPIGLVFFYTLEQSVQPYDNSRYSDDIEIAYLTPAILMNIVYLITVSVMIYLGVKRDNRAIVNISMIFLAIYLFGKYIAFAFESKIDGAYIFIGGGLACIAMTILIEKIRRRIMKSMG